MKLIDDCILRANNNYISITATEFTTAIPSCLLKIPAEEKERIQLLIQEIKRRLEEIIEDKDLSNVYCVETINDLKKYKAEIVAMIKALIQWLEDHKEDTLTISGLGDDVLRLINAGPS